MKREGPDRNSLENNQADFASVECISDSAGEAGPRFLRRLRNGVDLHLGSDGSAISTVAGLPPALKQGSYYVPVHQTAVSNDDDDHKQYLIKVDAPCRLYVLWPALQEPPAWLLNEFELVRGAEVKVRWSGFTFKQRLYLNITNQRRIYQEQVLLVFRLDGDHGLVAPGEELQLPFTATPGHQGSEQPSYTHVVCLRPFKDDSLSGAGGLTPTTHKRIHKDARSLANSSLLEVYVSLEDGSFDPTELAITEADSLLKRAMAAGDDELLFMLVEAGIGPCSSLPCLQLLLQYAQYEDLPQLAQQVLQQTAVELTQQVLEWLAYTMVKDNQIAEAEMLLASYCMSRRNPLSSVAAVEHAIVQAAHAGLLVSDGAIQLAKKFKAAKMALLQQLAQPHGSSTGDSKPNRQLVDSSSATDLQMMQEAATSSGGRSGSRFQSLQQAVRHCMQKSTAYMLGRGGSMGPVSIHDSSPYSYAVSLEDTDLLKLPAVVEYTRHIWEGLEMHKVLRAWQSAVAASATVAADSNTSLSARWGIVTRSRNVHAKQRAMARKSLQMSTSYTPKLPGVPESEQTVAAVRRKSLNLAPRDSSFAALSASAAGTGQASLDTATGSSTGQPSFETLVQPGSQGQATTAGTSPAADVGPVPSSGSATDSSSSSAHGSPTVVQSSLLFQPAKLTPAASAAAAMPAPQILLSSLYQPTASSTASPKASAISTATPVSPLASRLATSGQPQGPGPIGEGVEAPSSDAAGTKRPGRVSIDLAASSHRPTLSSVQGADGSEQAVVVPGDADTANTPMWLNPDVGVELLQNMGLAGGLSLPLTRLAAQLLHGVLLTPRALYNSARGRWLYRCWFEVAFLIVFQGLCMGYVDIPWALGYLPIMIIGNLVNSAFEVHWLHGGSFKNYISNHWAKLDLVVNTCLLVTLAWECFVYIRPESAEVLGLEHYGVHIQHVVPSAWAVLVWGRALGIFVPANERLGALLYTLRRAAAEAAVMVPLLAVLMFGFSTTLYVVYNHLYHEYSSIWGALRMVAVIWLGGHHLLLEFEGEESHHNPFLEAWGQIIIIVYAMIVNILIMTLLLAIITKTYNPESVKAKAVLMGAEAVRHYDWRVRHSLACSPINLVQLAFAWLPQGYRTRVSPRKCLSYWLPPLDGYIPQAVLGSPGLLVPTGPAEVAYLGYLLCLYPAITLLVIALMVLHMPCGAIYYTRKGHHMWMMTTWYGTANKQGAVQGNPAAARAAVDTFGWEKAVLSADGGRSNVTSGRNSSVEIWRANKHSHSSEVPRHMSGDLLAAVHTQSVMRVRAATLGRNDPRLKQAAESLSLHSRAAAAGYKIVYYLWNFVLEPALRHIAAAICGLLAELLLFVAVVFVLLVAWISRVLFSVYCIFAPGAANSNCCMRPTRTADYWSRPHIRSAFAHAKLRSSSQDGSHGSAEFSTTGLTKLSRGPSIEGVTMCQVVTQPRGVLSAAAKQSAPVDTSHGAPGALEHLTIPGQLRSEGGAVEQHAAVPGTRAGAPASLHHGVLLDEESSPRTEAKLH